MRAGRVGLWILAGLWVGAAAGAASGQDAAAAAGKFLVEQAAVRPGPALVVCLGGDGALAAAVGREERFVVQGLLAEAAAGLAPRVDQARRLVREGSEYGRVSIDRLRPPRLPYLSNQVNLLIADDLPGLIRSGLSLGEMVRVVCPGGVALVGQRAGQGGKALSEQELAALLDAAGLKDRAILKDGGVWAKLIKPAPAGTDEWTHPRHGPDGNRASRDQLVRVPYGLCWIAGPAWPRAHRCDSTAAVVSAGGRNIYVTANEASNFSRPRSQAEWFLVARDAFNGLLLWSRKWEGLRPAHEERRLISLKKWQGPRKPELDELDGRRPFPIVAVGDRVYTAGASTALVLDAATGKTLREIRGLDSTPDQMLVTDGRLVLATMNSVCAIDPAAGKVLWTRAGQAIDLTAGEDKVFFLDTAKVAHELVCLLMADGGQAWRVPAERFYPDPAGQTDPAKAKTVQGFLARGGAGKKMLTAIRLYQDGLLVVGSATGLYGVSAKDGGLIWTWAHMNRDVGHRAQHEATAADGLVWFVDDIICALDLHTGRQKTSYPGYMYTGCSRSLSAGNYLLAGYGVIFMDKQTGKRESFSGARGACRVGYVPANGLLYVPPQSCGCVSTALRGYLALGSKSELDTGPTIEDAKRLEKGPAFGATPPSPISIPQSAIRNPQSSDWPTFRGEIRRSASAACTVPSDLTVLWEAKLAEPLAGPLRDETDSGPLLGDRVTAATVAGGQAFAAIPESHQVAALDAGSGKRLWTFTAGARVQCPPTLVGPLCVFGCQDGWVYCLRRTDGEVVWRFQAAPTERRIPAFGQLESAWPVTGSVLAAHGLIYFTAGRSVASDGGAFLYALRPETGQVVWKKRLLEDIPKYSQVPVDSRSLGPVPDVVGDEKAVYLRLYRFDPATGEVGKADSPRYLVSSIRGQADGSWRRQPSALHRGQGFSYYLKGQRYTDIGAILVAFNRDWLVEYFTPKLGVYGWIDFIKPALQARRLDAAGNLPGDAPDWSLKVDLPAQVEALVLAGPTALAAVAPDSHLATHSELWAISAGDGKVLNKLKLPARISNQGLAVAAGRVFASLADGRMICLGKPDR